MSIQIDSSEFYHPCSVWFIISSLLFYSLQTYTFKNQKRDLILIDWAPVNDQSTFLYNFFSGVAFTTPYKWWTELRWSFIPLRFPHPRSQWRLTEFGYRFNRKWPHRSRCWNYHSLRMCWITVSPDVERCYKFILYAPFLNRCKNNILSISCKFCWRMWRDYVKAM